MGLFDIFGTGDQKQAAQDQISGINSGLGGLTNAINTGNQDLTTNFTAGLTPFLTNNNTATAGVNQYANALGLNGPSGNAQATAAFQNNPGYQFEKQQGDDAINAAEAASGKNFSGNQVLDLSKFNEGLAGTNWNQYMSQLGQFLPYSTQSAGGVAQGYQGLGTNLNANANTLGNANYGAYTSIGNANANADLSGLNASANGLGAILGLGKGILGFLSDERTKDDIEPVGKMFDGQTVYKYRYKGDPRHQIGLLAQEVEDYEPDAIVDTGTPLMAVNYDRATRFAADLGRYL